MSKHPKGHGPIKERISGADQLRVALVQLARDPTIASGIRDNAFRLITKTTAKVLSIERASIWLFNDNRTQIICQDLYEATADSHTSGATLKEAEYPAYFAALEAARIIAAGDATTDPRTSEFAESYLKPLNITSMLDAPIRLAGIVVGVICVEAVQLPCQWSQEQQEFTASIADLIALAMDLSERKIAETALRKSEELFRSVTVSATDAIICTNQHNDITIWNHSAARLFGYSLEEALGQNLEELQLFTTPLLAPPKHDLNSTAEQQSQIQVVTSTHRDGHHIPVEVSTARFMGPIGEHHTYIIRDIRQRIEMEKERMLVAQRTQQAQKLESLGVLAGGIAHDFNNLLGASLGRLELLRKTSITPLGEQHVTVMETTLRRAAELCNQLLAYSGRGAFTDENVDLNTIFTESLELIQVSISKKARLTHTLGTDLPRFSGDPAQIQQVIINLLANASDALNDQAGSIHIRTGQTHYAASELSQAVVDKVDPGHYLFLEVSDTGVGMTRDVQSRLFEPFFTTKFTGRGLGMAAVLGIVRRYKGTLFIESEPNKGTTIRVLIPANAPAKTVVGLRTQSEEALNTHHIFHNQGVRTVMVVDDDEAIRSTFALVLEQEGFTVIPAQHGRQAVDIFAARPTEFDCVILDLIMPEMDGEQTLYEMRRLRADLPIILTSGYSETEIQSRFLDESPTAFIQKPFQVTSLLNTIQTVLQRAAQQKPKKTSP